MVKKSTQKKAVKTVKTKKLSHPKAKVPAVVEKVVVVKDTNFTDDQLNKLSSLGTGILMPKQRYRFKASFVDSSTLKPIPESARMAFQLTRISEVEQQNMYVQKLELAFEDDILNEALNALKHFEKTRTFTLVIEYIDGNEKVVRTHYLKGARIINLRFGSLDYSCAKPVEIKAVVTYTSIAIV